MATTTPLRPSVERERPPNAPRSGRRFWPVALLALALVGTLGLAVAWSRPAERPFNGGTIEPATALPPFELQRAGGGRFRTLDTRGRVSLFFFGYTSCPDICPMTLAQVTQVRRQLGVEAGLLDAYFVTVDPERDAPERLARYVANFDPAIVGLTGAAEELERARAPFGAVARRREVPDSALGYLMDHSATIYLVDQESRIRLVYPPQATPAEITADVRRLLGR